METKDIKVSIIIPVYNVAPYIGDCLRSVMRQTYAGSMECLLVDDCGEYDSIGIAEKMMADYDGPIQFRILRHERNRGLSAARNTGTFAAVGDYLYYLDSDDEITDDCIEKLIQPVMEDPDIEMVQGNGYNYLSRGESIVIVKKVVLSLAKTIEEVRRCFYQYWQTDISVWNKLLKRRVIIDNKILCKEGMLFEDSLWIFYLLKYVKKAAFVADITYHYKTRSQSITTNTNERVKWYIYSMIYREIMNNLTPGYEQEECNYYARFIAAAYVSYVRMVPEYKEVLQLCQKKCKQYGCRFSQMVLAVSYVLGKFPFGVPIWNCLMWVKKMISSH